jgi:hypothetical protein
MYLPHTAGPLDSADAHLTSAACSALATGALAFYGDVNGKGGGLGTGSSWQLLSSKGSGTAKPIAEIGTDNVVDTQRRRYDKLIVTRNFLST